MIIEKTDHGTFIMFNEEFHVFFDSIRICEASKTLDIYNYEVHCCSIYRPNSDLYKEFIELLIKAGGKELL